MEEIHPETPLLGSTPTEKALVAMWERRVELDGFAAVMEAVRNAVPGLAGRALAGPHGYAQIPELAERSKLRVINFYVDLNGRVKTPCRLWRARTSAPPTSLRWRRWILPKAP